MNEAALLRTYDGVDDDGAIALFLSPKLSLLLTDYKVLWSIWTLLLPRTSLRNLLFSMHPMVSGLSYGAACLVKEFSKQVVKHWASDVRGELGEFLPPLT